MLAVQSKQLDLVRKAARFTARKLTLLRMELATEATESVKAVQKGFNRVNFGC